MGTQDDHSHVLNPHLASAVGGGGGGAEGGGWANTQDLPCMWNVPEWLGHSLE